MSTTTPTPASKRPLNRWATPAFGLFSGVVMLVASWLGGHPGVGVAMLAIMAVFSVGIVLAARRSETVKGLLDRRDERISTIDLQATALAGLALISAVLVAFVVELAHGRSGMPYAWLGAIGGLSYLVAVITLRLRG